MLGEETTSRPFLKVKYPCESHLLNACFKLDSVEFIQQDPNLGHCGTAALWVSTKAMAYRFGTNRFPYGAITRQAIGGWNRERDVNVVYDPSNMDSGVSVSEMRNALSETGANSITFMPHCREQPEEAFARICHEIYSFVESGIPVLLCLKRKDGGDAHVVTVVGHSLPNRIDLKSLAPVSNILGVRRMFPLSTRHYAIGTAIRLYYAHDDSYGPFNRVLMVNGEKGDGENVVPRINVRVGRRQEEYWLCEVIVPVPKMIRNFASQSLTELPEYFEAIEYVKQIFPVESGVFVWRSLCVQGSEFKQSVASRKFSPRLKHWYSSLHLPKYVWLYELSYVPEKANKVWESQADPQFNGKGRPIVGEFLYDATCPSYDVRLLSTRIMRVYWDHARSAPDEYDVDTEDRYYECFVPKTSDSRSPNT